MERFAVIIGLLVAGAFALSAITPQFHLGWNFSDVGFTEEVTPADPSQIATRAPARFAASRITITNLAAVVTLIPEDRTDIELGVENAGPLATPDLRLQADTLIVEGRYNTLACRDGGRFLIRDVGAVSRDALPRITARVPRNVDFSGNGLVVLDVGPSQSAAIELSRCSEASIADVTGALTLTLDGAADATVNRVGALEVTLTGAGDAEVARVDGRLQARLEGAGDLSVTDVTGPVSLAIEGSGDIAIENAQIPSLDVTLRGSGDVSLSGDVAATARVSIAGSGDVDLNASVGDLDASIQGSGTVKVGAVRASARQVVQGSGRIIVGGGEAEASAGAGLERRETAIIVQGGLEQRREVQVPAPEATKADE